MGNGVGTKANLKRRESKERVIGHLATGASVVEAMRQVGRIPRTFYYWQATDPQFKIDSERAQIAGSSKDIKQFEFANFRFKYFNMITYSHQRRVVEAIEDSKPGSVVMILLPPEGGKTTLIEDWLCYKLATQPNTRVGVICETKEIAQKRLGRVASRMTNTDRFPKFIEDYGPFKTPGNELQKPWNTERLTVEKANHDERDPSLEAKGAGTTIYGARWDYAILDDFQTLKGINRTENLVTFFRQEISTRVSKQGKIIIVGTRVGPGDVYETLLREDLVDDYINIPAIDELGNSYWPATYKPDGSRTLSPNGDAIGWSLEDLAKRRRQVGEEIWARVYMQKATSRTGRTFEESTLEACKDPLQSINSEAPYRGMILGLDPALSRYAGFIVGSYDFSHLTIVDGESVHGLMNYDAIFEVAEFYIRKWHIQDVVIEANNLQRGLARDSRIDAMKERYGFNVVEHTTNFNKFDEKIGIAAMAAAFRRGEIRIAYGDEDTKAKLDQLFSELANWRPDIPSKVLRQDMVMALWFVYLRWINMRKVISYDGNGWKRSSLADFTPTSFYKRIGDSGSYVHQPT